MEKPDAGGGDGEAVGQRFLTHDEVRAILPYLDDAHGRCCQFLLLTAARLREAVDATWSEIDFEAATWTIAAGRRKDTRSKTRRKQAPTVPHVVPLSRQAVALLREVRAAEVKRRKAAKIETAIADDDPIFVGERGGRIQNWDRWLKINAKSTGVSGWSAHSLRRTAATMAADLGAEPHVISTLLGHKNIGGHLTAVYSKSRYRKEHAEALQRLADQIDAIAANIDNVVTLRGSK